MTEILNETDLFKNGASGQETVPRFLGEGYPSQIFGDANSPVDHVLQHVIRCRNEGSVVIQRFRNNGFHAGLLDAILKVHDEAEFPPNIGDIVGPDKSSVGLPGLNRQILEEEGAYTRLCPNGYTFWQHFEKADMFLKNGNYIPHFAVLREAFLAVVIDKNDGNRMFNNLLTDWLCSNKYNSSVPMPPKKALDFTFKQQSVFKTHLNQWSGDPSLAKVCTQLLNETAMEIKEMWSNVQPDRIPPTISHHLM